MEQQQSMLAERGLILMGGDEDEEETLDEDEQERRTRAIVSQETANILSGLGKRTGAVSREQKIHLSILNITGNYWL